MLDDLHYRIIADDEFSQTYNRLLNLSSQAERNIQTLGRSVGQISTTANLGQGFAGLGAGISGLRSALAGLGIALSVRELYGFGRGLADLRATSINAGRSFELLSGGVAQAEARLRAVEDATGGALDKLSSMQLANKLMALGMIETTEDLERTARVAFVLGNAFGSVDEAISRMVLAATSMRAMRLDEIGISGIRVNQIFKEMGGTAGDNITYFKAITIAAEETAAQLGDPTVSSVKRLDAAFADLKRQLAEGWTGQFAASALEATAKVLRGPGDLDNMMNRVQVRLQALQGRKNQTGLAALLGDPQSTQEQIAALEKIQDAYARLNDMVKAGVPGAAELQKRVAEVGFNIAMAPGMTGDLVSQLDLAVDATGRLAYGFYSVQTAVEGIKIVNLTNEIQAAADRMQELTDFIRNGQQLFSPSYAGGNPLAIPLSGGIRPAQAIQDAEMDALREETKAKRTLIEEERRLAEENARKAQADWERAADATKAAFEGAARGIPGLFGTSPVTEKQLEMAKMGVPQNFADNYLRRLTDEVINKVPWADVDIEEAARAANINPNLPSRAILELFRQQWETGQLFANPENVNKFIDFNAVQQEFFNRGQANLGQQNLMAALKSRGLEQAFGQAGGFAGIEGLGNQFGSQLAGSLTDKTVAVPVAKALDSTLTSEPVTQSVESSAKTNGAAFAQALVFGFSGQNPGYRFVQIVFDQINAALAESEQNGSSQATGPEFTP